MKHTLVAGCLFLTALIPAKADTAAPGAPSLEVVKKYLVDTVQKMDDASHDFVTNAAAYQAIIDSENGDYDKAAMEHGVELGELVKKMDAFIQKGMKPELPPVFDGGTA